MFSIQLTKTVNTYQLVEEFLAASGIDLIQYMYIKGNNLLVAGPELTPTQQQDLINAYNAHVADFSYDISAANARLRALPMPMPL